MLRRSFLIIATALLAFTAGGAHAYDFWGVSVGTATFEGSTQLTFNGLEGSGAQYVVGGYKYTRVDGTWYGPFPAATPGEGYLASRRSDAQGLFFKPDANAARFTIITGSSQNGAPAPECGYETRLFGPGDLKIDVGGNTFGIGMRLDNLLWAADPNATQPHLKIYKAGGGIDSIYARDAGTLGDIELNPRWDRVGNQDLPAGNDMASAFFVSGSGANVGSASVDFEYTGIFMNGARVYAYEVAVPWGVLGIDPANCNFRASWRPDCGNDILSANFSSHLMGAPVPEPGSAISLLGGLLALAASRKRG